MRAFVWLEIALLLLGCARPPDTRFGAYDAIPAGQSRLYLYRPEHSAGPRDAGGVRLDHRPLASLDKGRYVTVLLPPGPYELAAGASDGSRFARLPARTIELAANRATYCALSAELQGLLVLWDLHCSGDSEEHEELRACRRDVLDRTVDWQP